MSPSVVAVDLGGTKTAAAVVDATGHLVTTKSKHATPAHQGAEAMLDVMAAAITGQFEQVEAAEVAAIGVGTAGGVNTTTGVIISATDTVTGWKGADIVSGLRARLPWASRLPIHVQNDVDAHAVGECWRGAGAGASSMLMLAVGTGIGGAFCLDGQVLRGAHHMAGEVGRLRIDVADGLAPEADAGPQVFEQVAAGPAILRYYRLLGGTGEAGRGQDVMALANDGDEVADRVVRALGRRVGRVLGWLALAMDPEVVVLGGGVPSPKSAWWAEMDAEMRLALPDSMDSLRLKRAKQRSDAALLGAARDAFRLAGIPTPTKEEKP